jgi:hypothetical protein
MKNVLIIFGAVLVVIALPLIFGVLHDARVDDTTNSFTTITTGVAETSSNVTLALPLYNDSITSVTSITSNVTTDAPTASDYNSVSRLLSFTGLVTGTTRTVTIEYEIDSAVLGELPSASIFLSVFAYFIIFGILGLIAGAIYGMFKDVGR